MSRSALISLAILTLVFGGLAYVSVTKPEVPLSGTAHPSEGQDHLATLDQEHAPYASSPPTSGPHYTEPAPWGVSEVTIPDEQVIHNLEHGGVVISYQPSLPEAEQLRLRAFATELTARDGQTKNKGYKVILMPRAKNESPIEISAWTYSQSLQTIDTEQIQQFYRDHLNKAPEGNSS